MLQLVRDERDEFDSPARRRRDLDPQVALIRGPAAISIRPASVDGIAARTFDVDDDVAAIEREHEARERRAIVRSPSAIDVAHAFVDGADVAVVRRHHRAARRVLSNGATALATRSHSDGAPSTASVSNERQRDCASRPREVAGLSSGIASRRPPPATRAA